MTPDSGDITTSQRERLIRIDERLRQVSLLVAEIRESLDEQFVTRKEFDPIRNIVLGLVATILIAVVGALITGVIK